MKRRKSTHEDQIRTRILTDPLRQLGRFWLLLIGGALCWGGLLLLLLWFSPHKQNTNWPAEIPTWIHTAYLTGLYLWLSVLTVAFRPRGWPRWQHWLKQAGLGYGLGSLLLLGFWLLFSWSNGLRFSPPQLSSLMILHGILLGWLLAGVEEAVFRGVNLELLGQRYPALGAVSAQALLYAILHLLHPQHISLKGLTALSGLFAVGCCLGLLRLYTGQLALGTGLHAGWISLSTLGAWSQGLKWSDPSGLWSGQGNPAQGLSGLLCFALLSVWLWHLLPASGQLWHNEAKRQ